nr:GDSL-type esterase/lipase family protein [bacterium]
MKKNLMVLAGAVVFALLLLEVTVRVLGLAPDTAEISSSGIVFSTNPKLRYTLKPGGVSYYRKTAIEINPAGYRGRVRGPDARPPRTLRVICIGDSVTMGVFLEDDETYCSQLEELLNRENVRGRSWEVLNFGVLGYNTINEVELLKEKGLAYHPDVVILQYCFNDHRNKSELDMRFRGALVRNHRLVYMLTQPLARILAKSKLFLFCAVRLKALDPDEEDVRKSMEEYYYEGDFVSQGLAEFKKLADRFGFEPLVLIFPKFEGKERFSEYEKNYRVVTVPCEENRLPFINLLDRLKADYPDLTPYPAFHYDS